MLTKLASFDFSKFSLTTSSGFIVSAAVFFTIDALTPDHLTESLFIDNSAGGIVAFGLIAVVMSGVLGLIMDSIYHTFGRWYAKKYWGPLAYSWKMRDLILQDIGLKSIDFEWIFASNKEKNTADIEKEILRFTEVAGSLAYTMMLLLGPSIFLLLKYEYQQSWGLSFISALLVIIGGYILLFTSAASLYKYETRTTAYVMDDIRKLYPALNLEGISNTLENDRKLTRQKWQPKKLAVSLWAIGIALVLLFSMNLVEFTEVGKANDMSELIVIGQQKGDTQNTNVPTIEIAVSKDVATPVTKTATSILTLKNLPCANTCALDIKNKENLTKSVSLPEEPNWKLVVTLFSPTRIANTEDVYLYLNLSFKDEKGNTLASEKITEGEWVFPIIVNINNNVCLLAQVRVKITSSASAQKSEGDAASKPAASKNTAEKVTADKFSANKVTADKFNAEKFSGEKVTADKVTADNIVIDKSA
jgi:hypothetical protein